MKKNFNLCLEEAEKNAESTTKQWINADFFQFRKSVDVAICQKILAFFSFTCDPSTGRRIAVYPQFDRKKIVKR